MDKLNGDFNRGYTKALIDVSNFFDNYSEALTSNRLYTQKGIRAVLDFILANREELRETGNVKDIIVRKDKKDPVLGKRAGKRRTSMFERFDKDQLQPITITQFDPLKIIDGYFSNGRIDKSTVPEGWFVYDLLEGEDGDFIEIKESVLVNHGGSVALPEKLDIPACGYLELLDMDETNRATATADYTF